MTSSEYPRGSSAAQVVWLDELAIEINELVARDGLPLPWDFGCDYSPESLPTLEAAALACQDLP
ncbi:hypothetical protein ABZ851_03500 [Streptomyces sp. NPDC047049]|uniref:hypothetical protein n=1 Tax=Streptomyces sp. NPDC047049 TaxID=3156688 RepID=UPI0033FDF35F